MVLESVAGELDGGEDGEEGDAEEEDAEEDGEVVDGEDVGEVVVGVPVGGGGGDGDDEEGGGGGVAPDFLPNLAEDERAGDDQRGQDRQDEFGDDQLILEVHAVTP